MKFLRYINILAILLIFSPFFQLCTSNSKNVDCETEYVDEQIELDSGVESKSYDNSMEDLDDEKQLVLDDQPIINHKKINIRVIWDLMVSNNNEGILTGFGMTVILFLFIIDQEINQLAILSFLISTSLILTLISLLKVFRNHILRLKFIYFSNSFILIASFIFAYIIFEELNQIKWGFYAYSFSIFILTFMSFLFRKKAFNKKEVANFMS